MMLTANPPFVPLAAERSLPAPGADVSDAGQVVRQYLADARRELHSRHAAGEGGIAVVTAYTAAVDHLVRFLFASATAHYLARNPRIVHRCTVVAQGGYGRGELNPHSDLDLLFLFPWKLNPYVETVVDVVYYALLDGGFDVAHAVRNVRECGRLASRDLKVRTALLDARYLCGDREAFAAFEAAMLDEAFSSPPMPFFKEKLAEAFHRHARLGDSVYLLQPHLKDGAGGLRDLHTALWLAKTKFKVATLRDLVALGVLAECDLAEVERAVDFLWRVRNAMHLAAAGHHDQLTFELQERLAPALGFGDGPPGVEAFMRTYYGHAASVHRVSEAIIGRCVQPTEPYRGPQPLRTIRDGMRIQGRVLSVVGADVFAAEPASLVSVFAEAQRHAVTLSPETRELVREQAPRLAAAPAREVAAAFLAVLRAPQRVYETLAEMHRLGVLKRVVPEFERLECLIAHDPFHVYTVDQHSLMGVRELERLRAGEFEKTVPHLTQVMKEVAQPELLFLGMLLHDVGKGYGHDHDRRGAEMTRAVAGRLGLNVDEQAACEFLVQHHLLMSHLAQRRDVHDDELVSRFCRTVGSVDNLQRLYVLTYADMRAVGPGVYNDWRDSLLGELYLRAREFFETGTFQAEDRGARAARVRTRVVEAAPVAARATIARFAERMPDSYFLATPESMIRVEAEAMARFEAREAGGERPALALAATPFPGRGFTELVVCTRDRPGLFAMLSGVLAAHELNILAARITTSRDQIALDAFRISQAGEETDDERWERVEGTLRRVLAGEENVEELVRRSRRPSLLRRPRRRVATVIEVDNRVSRTATVLDVQAADRVGLLFTITNCLYHLWLEIHLAKINTMVDQVLDVFYVTDHEGRKIEDAARLEHIRSELGRALADGADVSAPAARAAPG